MIYDESRNCGPRVAPQPRLRDTLAKGILKTNGGEVVSLKQARVLKERAEQGGKLRELLVGELGLKEGYTKPVTIEKREWFTKNFEQGAALSTESHGEEILISSHKEIQGRVFIMHTFMDPEADWYTPLTENEYEEISALMKQCPNPCDKYCNCPATMAMQSLELDIRGRNGSFRLAELTAHLLDEPYDPADDAVDPREMRGYEWDEWK